MQAVAANNPLGLELDALNAQLRDATPQEIITFALGLQKKTIVTTSFSPNSGGLLHMLTRQQQDLPVIWVDGGYNTRDAYLTADKLISGLSLNMQIYTPEMTSARRDAVMGIPTGDDPDLHKEFSRQVKVEPFNKAMTQWSPDVWFSGIRREETEFRKTLDILSYDARGILRVAPLFYWTEEQLEAYMETHELPSCKRYFDPTKLNDGAECGIHTSL